MGIRFTRFLPICPMGHLAEQAMVRPAVLEHGDDPFDKAAETRDAANQNPGGADDHLSSNGTRCSTSSARRRCSSCGVHCGDATNDLFETLKSFAEEALSLFNSATSAPISATSTLADHTSFCAPPPQPSDEWLHRSSPRAARRASRPRLLPTVGGSTPSASRDDWSTVSERRQVSRRPCDLPYARRSVLAAGDRPPPH